MDYNLNIEKISLNNEKDIIEVKEFLKGFDLNLDENIDYTVVIRDQDKIKATASKSKNVFKCFAIAKDLQGEGIANKLITALNDKLFEEGVYHSFIFTKPDNLDLFKDIGYKFIAEGEGVVLLENGMDNIERYLERIKKKYNIDTNKKHSALVMNCNPFTKGHRYLIETAAKNSEQVLVFIVEEDKSLFPFKVRYNLVKEGVKDLENVTVIPGGEYIISSATFPAYFLREESKVLKGFTSLDANIFGKHFCRVLNIDKRFVGEEPYCNVTRAYNETLEEVLKSYGVKLKIIERKSENGVKISASMVRDIIKKKEVEDIRDLVPEVTYNFLKSEGAASIVEKIKKSNSVH